MSAADSKHTGNPLNLGKEAEYYDLLREEVVGFVSNAKLKADRVIELGCSSGRTGEAIRRVVGATRYVGVERSQEAAEHANRRLDEVHVADLDATDPRDLLPAPESFDLLIMLDVLEHLYDPWDVLARWAELIRPGGHFVASIPNIQNINVLAELAEGHFQYRKHGLLDSTHIRFFTRNSIPNLLTGAGFEEALVQSVFHGRMDVAALRPSGNNATIGRLTISNLTREQAIPLCTYQYLVLGRKI